ncbi:MAG: molybdenum cofactor guanylyltransferase [Herpetosiphon sp.]
MRPTEHDPISAVVVAGGQSSRLGQDKRRLKLWGEAGPTLLERTAGLLAAWSDDVIIVLNDAAAWPTLTARLTPDLYGPSGSLGGIASGLTLAKHPFALVVAADMPFLSPQLVHWMIEQPRSYDILAPRGGGDTKSGGWEPLCAIYSRRCLPVMDERLRTGSFKIRPIFDRLNAQAIEAEVQRKLDPRGMVFQNINTPVDLEQVQRELALCPAPGYNATVPPSPQTRGSHDTI